MRDLKTEELGHVYGAGGCGHSPDGKDGHHGTSGHKGTSRRHKGTSRHNNTSRHKGTSGKVA